MRYYQAQDTFTAELGDGTQRLVTRGEPLPESHELVVRDLEAGKGNPDRAALFRPMDDGAPEPKPRRGLKGGT